MPVERLELEDGTGVLLLEDGDALLLESSTPAVIVLGTGTRRPEIEFERFWNPAHPPVVTWPWLEFFIAWQVSLERRRHNVFARVVNRSLKISRTFWQDLVEKVSSILRRS